MLPLAGQTAGPNGLTFFVDPHGWPVDFLGQKNEFVFNFFCQFFTSNFCIPWATSDPSASYCYYYYNLKYFSGTFNLFLSILLIIPLAAYLANSEVPGLNPIKDNQK